MNKIENVLQDWFLKGKIIDKREGTIGIVYIVKQRGSPEYIAYKTIKKEYLKNIEKIRLEKFIHEIRKWFKVRGHPLIITPHYVMLYEGMPLISMPFCELSLYEYLEKRKKLDVVESLIIIAQILKGLIYARSKGIEAHQDLKTQNVLLEDLSRKFVDFPPNDLPWFRYRVRIADFGNANAWKELGRPHGSRPYMAPEQYEEGKDFSKVDVFATGVILHELLTGVHPVGEKTSNIWPEPAEGFPKKYKHEKPWRKWAKSKDKQIKIGENKIEKDLENLIRKMLSSEPAERISLDVALEEVMRLLSSVNEAAARQLKLLFDYYDCMAEYFYECRGRLSNLMELSKIPGQLNVIIDEMFEEIVNMEHKIDSPAEAVYFCELCHKAAFLLIKRSKNKDKEMAERLAEKIIDKTLEWQREIKAHHKYPPLKFKGQELIRTPRFRDFEIFSELIGYGKTILERIRGKEYTRRFFDKNEYPILKAAYLFNITTDFHMRGDEIEALKVLDECIAIYPDEATFYFMKTLWTFHYIRRVEVFRKLKNAEKQKLIKVIYENANKAIKLTPEWEEPKDLLKRVKRFFAI